MAEKSFRPGEVFFRPGDPSEQAYLIQSGQVEILAGEVRVALLGSGEVFGEMALVEERPHTLTARAVSEGTAATMTRSEFERGLLHDPQQCRKYLSSLFERLRSLTGRLGEQGTSSEPVPTPSVRVTLYPLTRKAAEVLPDDGLTVPKFPFRIGRASEAHEPDALDLNDLWLLDSKPFNVSRNHLAIERWGQDRCVVKDRGSFLGTIVNEQVIGGKSHQRFADLEMGDNVLVVGGPRSPYQFRVSVQSSV